MGARTKVLYCTSCCRWDGSRRDKEGRLVAGPRSDNCNTGNTAPGGNTPGVLCLGLVFTVICHHLIGIC